MKPLRLLWHSGLGLQVSIFLAAWFRHISWFDFQKMSVKHLCIVCWWCWSNHNLCCLSHCFCCLHQTFLPTSSSSVMRNLGWNTFVCHRKHYCYTCSVKSPLFLSSSRLLLDSHLCGLKLVELVFLRLSHRMFWSLFISVAFGWEPLNLRCLQVPLYWTPHWPTRCDALGRKAASRDMPCWKMELISLPQPLVLGEDIVLKGCPSPLPFVLFTNL